MDACILDLTAASPARFPGERRRRGTNWGLRDGAEQWLCIEGSVAAFDTVADARSWLNDPQAFGKDRPMTFQRFNEAALAQ